jgi:hypothetical protein
MLQFIAENMRNDDIEEVRAASNKTPIKAITDGVRISDFSSVAVINGDVVAVMGVVKGSTLSDSGVAWLLGTTYISKHRREFLDNSHKVLNAMLDICPELSNYVHAKNKTSIRWLSWLGFQINDPEPFGVNNELFHEFTIRKGCNV